MALTTPVVNVEGIMEESLRHLQKLGFSDYEARAYVALLRDYPATRYQLSQNAAIPESKIYEVVRRLQDKGVIAGLQGRPPRFVPLAPQDLVDQLDRRTQQSLDDLRHSLPRVAEQPVGQWSWNVEGYDAIIARAKALIESAESAIIAAMWHQEAAELADSLRSASEMGIRLTLLAYDPCNIDFGDVREHGFEEAMQRQVLDAQGRLLAVVADGTRVLVASSLDQAASGVWTNHSALATIVHRYVSEHFYDR
jgi:sugar-specific transcriptional regulator TrmB